VSVGFTLWFTGLPGSGKTTVSTAVAETLRSRGVAVEVLDGDVVRRSLSSDLSFSREDREMNIRRIAFVSDLLSRNGVAVIAAAISPFRATREEARRLMGERFIEIYVAAPVEVCEGRDPKGLYAKARAGEISQFTGIDDPYEAPESAEVVLPTHEEPAEQSLARVVELLEARGLIPGA